MAGSHGDDNQSGLECGSERKGDRPPPPTACQSSWHGSCQAAVPPPSSHAYHLPRLHQTSGRVLERSGQVSGVQMLLPNTGERLIVRIFWTNRLFMNLLQGSDTGR